MTGADGISKAHRTLRALFERIEAAPESERRLEFSPLRDFLYGYEAEIEELCRTLGSSRRSIGVAREGRLTWQNILHMLVELDRFIPDGARWNDQLTTLGRVTELGIHQQEKALGHALSG